MFGISQNLPHHPPHDTFTTSSSYRLRHHPLITLTNTLIPTNLRILPLPPLHQRLQLRIIILRHRLRRHLNHTPAPRLPNTPLNLPNRRLQTIDSHHLLQTLTRQHIQRRRNEFHFYLCVGRAGVEGFGGAEGGFDGVDAFVALQADQLAPQHRTFVGWGVRRLEI